MPDTQTALHAQNRAVTAANINSADRDAEIEIDLGELFLRLLDKWYIIVAAALVGTMLSGIWTFFFVTPQYEATTKLYILNSDESVINLSSLQLGSQLACARGGQRQAGPGLQLQGHGKNGAGQ